METNSKTLIPGSANSLIVSCPNCFHDFQVGDVVFEQLRQEAKNEFESAKREWTIKAQEREESLALREQEVKDAQAKLTKEIDERVSRELKAKLEKEYPEILSRARNQAQSELSQELVGLQADLQAKAKEIAKLHQDQATLFKQQRDLKAEKERFEYDKQKAITEALESEQGRYKADLEQQYLEKFQMQQVKLDRATKQVEELSQKLKAKPSQELQGEAQEMDIEMKLALDFPLDQLEPIKKGQRGADILQTVKNRLEQSSGTILWETKNAQNWSSDWIAKLKQDQREARATVAIIVTNVAPEGIDSFEMIDGVWICKPDYAIALAAVIREGLHQTAEARRSAEGLETKATLVYKYLMGEDFKSRFGAIVETFVQMQKRLVSEKNASTKNFNQREKQHETVLKACFGVLGDLQGIAGQDLKSLAEIEIKALPINEEDI